MTSMMWNAVFSSRNAKILTELIPDAHPMVSDWPLMSLDIVVIIVLAYFSILSLLMGMMAYRSEGYSIKPMVLLHNFAMTIGSLYMCVETIHQAVSGGYSLFGNYIISSSDNANSMARILWIFYVSKIVEFIDTFIMALRCRFRQISFLHLYHHSSIFVVWWGIVRYCPGGDPYFCCALNSFIHVVMYGYYFWSAVNGKRDPNVKISWRQPAYYRQTITRMQISQFIVMLAQASYNLMVLPEGLVRNASKVLFVYMLTMLSLFGKFYYDSYRSKAVLQLKIDQKEIKEA